MLLLGTENEHKYISRATWNNLPKFVYTKETTSFRISELTRMYCLLFKLETIWEYNFFATCLKDMSQIKNK